MFGRSVGIAAACAVGASAFLLPPNANPTTQFADPLSVLREGAELHDLIEKPDSKHVPFHIVCPSCNFEWTQDEASLGEESDDMHILRLLGSPRQLFMDFTISDDGKQVLLDGTPLYPVPRRFGFPTPHEYRVAQVAEALHPVFPGERAQPAKYLPLVVTEYSLSVTEREDQVDVVDFEILALNGRPMNVGGAEIAIGKTSEDGMVLANVTYLFPSMRSEAPEASGPSGMKHHGPKECKNLPAPLCAFKNSIEAHFHAMKDGAARKMRPCPGRKGPGHGRPHHRIGPDGRPLRHHGRPHHMRPHGHQHEHHYMHGFLGVVMVLIGGVLTFLVFYLAGIAVGTLLGFVGLLFSRAIIFVWRKMSSGGDRGDYAQIPQDATHVEEGAKVGIAEMEAPPAYEDAPLYEDVEKA